MIHELTDHEPTQKCDIHRLYVKYVVELRPDERENGKLKLHQQESFISFTTTVPTTERLSTCIINVLDDITDWKPSELAHAFDILETYALNLLDYPWKKEFRIILVILIVCDI